MIKKIIISAVISVVITSPSYALSNDVTLRFANNDIHNKQSLQNGAKLFMNYCSGCHSISYMRYSRLAQDLELNKELISKNFIFNERKIGDTIISAMPKDDSANWFGIAPPDLSLTARSRGVDWVYTYLHSFYKDKSRPFGVNNYILEGVAMPDVLEPRKAILTASEFDQEVRDISNFLDYVSEPIALHRKFIGTNVLIFLGILLVLSYLLKKEYWQDVKKGIWRAKD